MPVEGSVVGSVRDRRRAETVREIKDAALQQLDEVGAAGLSLRAAARAVGMTVQSIYHYFDSRDALIAALVVDGHNALADTVEAAAESSRGRPHVERLLAATGAYRQWALQNRPAFLLLYGNPIPGYQAPDDEPIGDAARRIADPFLDVVFDGWTPEQLASIPLAARAVGIPDLQPVCPLPPGAMALFFELRGRMHGLVMLELVGHLVPLQEYTDDVFRGMVRRMADELERLQSAR